ncbi:MAG: MFS transporter [Promethearchaeota archaeon]|jgi:MFS family permease
MKIQNVLTKSEDQSLMISKISLITAILFASLAGYAYFAFIPAFLRSKNFSDGQVIFIMTWMGIGMAIFSWIFGRISDKSGRRKLFFILALLFQVILLSLLNLSNHIVFHCVLNFLRGIILGMRMPASNALFADIVENSSKKNGMKMNFETTEISGTQLSLLSATKSFGWAIGVLSSSYLISVFGEESLVLFLIITTIISLFFAIPIRDITKDENLENQSDKKSIQQELDTNKVILSDNIKSKKRSKIKLILYLSVFFRQFGVIPFIQIIYLLLTDSGIPVELTGIVIALNPISQVVAMIINGRFIDNPKISEKLMLAIGFILSSLTLLCYYLGSASGLIIYFILGQISLGFAWGCIYTGAMKYIVNRAPLDRAFYTGIWMADLQIAKILSYQVSAFIWIIIFPILPAATLPFAMLIPLIGLVLVHWL